MEVLKWFFIILLFALALCIPPTIVMFALHKMFTSVTVTVLQKEAPSLLSAEPKTEAAPEAEADPEINDALRQAAQAIQALFIDESQLQPSPDEVNNNARRN